MGMKRKKKEMNGTYKNVDNRGKEIMDVVSTSIKRIGCFQIFQKHRMGRIKKTRISRIIGVIKNL